MPSIRQAANRCVTWARKRAQRDYDLLCLNIESHYHDYMGTFKSEPQPFKVVTAISKVYNNIKRLRQARVPSSTPKNTPTRNLQVATGRINKHYRWHSNTTKERCGIHASNQAEKWQTELEHTQYIAWQQTPAASKVHIAQTEPVTTSKPSGQMRPATSPEHTPYLPYPKSTGPPNPDMDHAARENFVYEKLPSFLRKEGMLCVGYPSGHSGIDPVIAEYNKQKAISDFWERFHTRRIEEHRKAEEQQLQLARYMGRAEQLARYMWRVEQLASFGCHLSYGISLFENALGQRDLESSDYIIQRIIIELLEPADALLKEMNKEIPLEEQGARILWEQWPVGRLDKVYTFLQNQSSLSAELLYFCKGIEAVCGPLISLTRYNFVADVATGSGNGNPNDEHIAPDPVPTAVPAAENEGKSFASFADFVRASRAPQHNQQAPETGVTPPSNIVKDDVALHMARTLSELQMIAPNLMNGYMISAQVRRNITNLFKDLLAFAQGQKSLFDADENGQYKMEIEKLLLQIKTLPGSMKKSTKMRELNILAHDVLILWVAE